MLRDAQRRREGKLAFLGQPSLWGQKELRGARGAAFFTGARLQGKIELCIARRALRSDSLATNTSQSLGHHLPVSPAGFVEYPHQQWSWGVEEASRNSEPPKMACTLALHTSSHKLDCAGSVRPLALSLQAAGG